MTQPAAADIKKTYPPDNALRIGEVVSASTGAASRVVSVQNAPVNAGYILAGSYPQAAPIALVRGESSWLALGRVLDATTAANTQALLQQSITAGSTNYVLTTAFTDIPGLTVTFTSAFDFTYKVTGMIDTVCSVTATTVAQYKLGGATNGAISSTQFTTSGQQFMCPGLWVGNLSAGTYTLTVQAAKTVNVSTITANQTTSTALFEFWG